MTRGKFKEHVTMLVMLERDQKIKMALMNHGSEKRETGQSVYCVWKLRLSASIWHPFIPKAINHTSDKSSFAIHG